MKELNTVIVASDVCIFGEGLSTLINRDGRLAVLSVANSASALNELLTTCHPHVVLLDMGLPSAQKECLFIRDEYPSVKIVALCVGETPQEIQRCANAGVAGIVSRNQSVDAIVDAVWAAERGEFVCTPTVSTLLWQQLSGEPKSKEGDVSTFIDQLTPREIEVAILVSRGYSNKQIARKLNIAVSTTKNHVHNMLEKMGVQHRTAAAIRFRDAVSS